MFQDLLLFPHLTVRENVAYPLEIRKIPKSRRWAISDYTLGLVDLTGYEDRLPRELSGGMQQRVGIARALMNSPELLLVDEPTSALDHDRGLAIIDLLRGLTVERGVGTVVVTHDLATLGEHDEVVRIVDGRISEPVAR